MEGSGTPAELHRPRVRETLTVEVHQKSPVEVANPGSACPWINADVPARTKDRLPRHGVDYFAALLAFVVEPLANGKRAVSGQSLIKVLDLARVVAHRAINFSVAARDRGARALDTLKRTVAGDTSDRLKHSLTREDDQGATDGS